MKVTKVRDPADMTPEEVAEILESLPILEHWIKSVKAHAYNLLRDGGSIPGYKLGYGVRRRVWKEDCTEALLATLAKHDIKPDEVYHPRELFSPAQLEEHLKFLKLMPGKRRGQERKPSIIDEFITKSMPEPKVVKADEEGEPEMRRMEASEEFSQR